MPSDRWLRVRFVMGALGAVLVMSAFAAPASADEPGAGLRRAVFVGNNWEGTADVLAPGTFKKLGTINIIPDREERMQEIATNPERLAYFLAIREAIGEGHDQYVDDMYSSNDGRLMIVSRPSFADVVAISLDTGEIEWRFPVAGQRSDHMAISPDGKVVASGSSDSVVRLWDTKTGTLIANLNHDNEIRAVAFSPDGSTLATGSDDKLVQLWDLRSAEEARR